MKGGSMTRNWLTRLIVAGVAATAGIGVAVPAIADYAVSGSCSTDGYQGNATTFYIWTTANVNKVTKFQYILQNPSSTGNKSNVNIRHKEDKSFATDPTLYSYNSPDDRVFNYLYTHYPTITVQLPDGRKQYTNFQFIFDKNNADDPSCTARTSTFS
jgi:hypothetical protein